MGCCRTLARQVGVDEMQLPSARSLKMPWLLWSRHHLCTRMVVLKLPHKTCNLVFLCYGKTLNPVHGQRLQLRQLMEFSDLSLSWGTTWGFGLLPSVGSPSASGASLSP